MWSRLRGRALRLLGMIFSVAALVGVTVWAYAALPGTVRLAEGQDHELRWSLPLPVTVHSNNGQLLSVGGAPLGPEGRHVSAGAALQLNPQSAGAAELDFRLFGWIPFRRVTVSVIPPMHLIPGGHSIGVVLRSQGVMVVGYGPVHDPDGRLRHPGRAAGIEVGDVILRINGQEVGNETEAQQLVEATAGRTLRLEILRRGQRLVRQVQPLQDAETGRWRLGLYVRDGAAGIGTLTFVDPVSGRYGALGHVIADSETQQPIQVRDGHIIRAAVTRIEHGEPGRPGEKVGFILEQDPAIGRIERNSPYGIFGTMLTTLENPLVPRSVPVGLSSQVHEGPAEIITVVSEQELERFDIEIVRVSTAAPEGKNLVVRVTDPRLLALTNGIVQGMSGSPILQDGRLVGAVTHVFVNDPTRGYGVLIEQMLREAGLLSDRRDVAVA